MEQNFRFPDSHFLLCLRNSIKPGFTFTECCLNLRNIESIQNTSSPILTELLHKKNLCLSLRLFLLSSLSSAQRALIYSSPCCLLRAHIMGFHLGNFPMLGPFLPLHLLSAKPSIGDSFSSPHHFRRGSDDYVTSVVLMTL